MTSTHNPIGFIVLAAGLSSRFNGNKLLTQLPNSELSVLESTLLNIPIDAPVHVVYRPSMTAQEQVLERLAIERPSLSFNGDDTLAEGMGLSIAKGVRDKADWGGWVICLSDMPWVKTATYLAIANALEQHHIVVPSLETTETLETTEGLQKGNPVGFSKKFLQNLLNLSGDKGGRAIVQNNPEHVYRLRVEDPGILLDIDYPDDINQ